MGLGFSAGKLASQPNCLCRLAKPPMHLPSTARDRPALGSRSWGNGAAPLEAVHFVSGRSRVLYLKHDS
jgi:hypothetical protein